MVMKRPPGQRTKNWAQLSDFKYSITTFVSVRAWDQSQSGFFFVNEILSTTYRMSVKFTLRRKSSVTVQGTALLAFIIRIVNMFLTVVCTSDS